MEKQKSLEIKMEVLWWLFTALVVIAVLFPIIKNVENYPFYLSNTVFIVVFITFARYFFLLKHTFLAYRRGLKVIIFFACLPLIFYISNEINALQAYLDDNGIDQLVKNLPYEKHWSFASYVKTQMNFFGAASLVVAILFPLRLLISIWRNWNRGTV